jgi:hypothetical protein
MKTYKLSELILDFDLYPRGKVDSQHAANMVASLDAGAEMPPMVIEKKTKRVVDGFHRWRAYSQTFDLNYEVTCIEKTYANDGELFLDAMRYNSAHGRALTPHDMTGCIIKAKKFKLSDHLVGEALHLTTEKIKGLRGARIGSVSGRPIALKYTIQHMAGHKLTKKQEAANKKLSGMNQLFYVNQLIELIENGLLDSSNEKLLTGLEKLRGLLDSKVMKAA